MKPTVILDPDRRTMDEVFDPTDLAHLHEMTNVVWGRDDPMPPDEFERCKRYAFAVITRGWRYGPIDQIPALSAILEVGGRHSSPTELDYDACFARSIRVLS